MKVLQLDGVVAVGNGAPEDGSREDLASDVGIKVPCCCCGGGGGGKRV